MGPREGTKEEMLKIQSIVLANFQHFSFALVKNCLNADYVISVGPIGGQGICSLIQQHDLEKFNLGMVHDFGVILVEGEN